MGVALVTGPSDQQLSVSALLSTAGHETVGPAGGAGGRPFDWYVQLPERIAGRAPTEEIADRVAAVGALADRMATGAKVVLVAPGWDWRQHGALRLLAEATLAGSPARDASVLVLGSLTELAATVSIETVSARPPSLADVDPGRAFADWREDMLSLAEESERTYFGWQAGDGASRVAVLAGAVMSPVNGLGQRALAWGGGEDGNGLAAALLADTLGPEGLCDACAGEATDCLHCHGTGLTATVQPLATAFAAEIVVGLPATGFEMRVSDVLGWAWRQSSVSPVPELVRHPRLRPVPSLRRLVPTVA